MARMRPSAARGATTEKQRSDEGARQGEKHRGTSEQRGEQVTDGKRAKGQASKGTNEESCDDAIREGGGGRTRETQARTNRSSLSQTATEDRLGGFSCGRF